MLAIFCGEMTIIMGYMDGLDSMNVSGAFCIQIINEKDWGYGFFSLFVGLCILRSNSFVTLTCCKLSLYTYQLRLILNENANR